MKALRYSTALLAFGLLFTGISGVTAQKAGVSASAQRTPAFDRARASLPAAQRAVFTDLVSTARKNGLPVEPLVDKVLEGAAKRAAPDLIIAVVKARSEQLSRAQTLVRSRSATEIVQVADAIQRGVPPAAIQQIRAQARPNEPVGLAVHTMADLLDTGVPANVAIQMIGGWRTRGALAAELRELPAAVERLKREGATPARAAGAVASALRSGRSANTVRMGVELLDNGRAPGVQRAGPRGGTSVDRPTVVPRPAPAKAKSPGTIKGN